MEEHCTYNKFYTGKKKSNQTTQIAHMINAIPKLTVRYGLLID